MFVLKTRYVFGRNTAYLYRKHRMFLSETRDVRILKTLCFYEVAAFFILIYRFYIKKISMCFA